MHDQYRVGFLFLLITVFHKTKNDLGWFQGSIDSHDYENWSGGSP